MTGSKIMFITITNGIIPLAWVNLQLRSLQFLINRLEKQFYCPIYHDLICVELCESAEGVIEW